MFDRSLELFDLFGDAGGVDPCVGVWDDGIVVDVPIDAESFAARDPHRFPDAVVSLVDSIVSVLFSVAMEARCLFVDLFGRCVLAHGAQ